MTTTIEVTEAVSTVIASGDGIETVVNVIGSEQAQVIEVFHGDKGEQGEQGEQGEPGPPGPSVAVSGTGLVHVTDGVVDPAAYAIPGVTTPTGTGWRHVTAGAEDPTASTPSAEQVGADPAGSAATVQTNLQNHVNTQGTLVHGLGTASLRADSYFDVAGAAAGAQSAATSYTDTKLSQTTVNGHALSTSVSVSAADVGLGNVPNTDFTADILHSKWGLSTGVIDGCVLSIDPVDNTKIKNTAGHCLYVDSSDPEAPVVEVLAIPEASTTPTVGGDGLGTLFIAWAGFARTSAGVGAITFATEFTESDRRRITVGGRFWATGIGATSIAAVTNYTTPAWGADKTMEDLAYALGGSINIDGNDFTAHTGQLTVDKGAGHSFRIYGNSGTNRDVPNNPVNSAIIPVTSYRYWAASGSSYGNAFSSTIDPDYYDNAGTRTAVPSGKWTIQRVYYYPGSSTIAVTYGQAYFDTLDAAKAAANTQVIAFSEMAGRMFHGGLLRSRIYVQQGSTNLDSAYVERMTAFVGGGAGGGGGTVADHATLAHLDYAGSGHTGFVPATRTINGHALTGDVSVTASDVGADASGAAATVQSNLTGHTNLQATAHGGIVLSNASISPGTGTKITADAKGLVTAIASATTADIADSTDRRYCTDAQKTVITNTSGTNSGDETGAGIRTKLGITTLSGSNTGDQTLPTDATIVTTDVTTNNAGTIKHGWSPKVTAPAANQLVVVGIANGETVQTGKTIIGATTPSTQAYGDSASHGTSLEAAAADHKHAMPAAYSLPTATASVLGGVKPDGTSVLNSSGIISATAASVGALPTGTTTASIPDSADKRYVTDAQRTVLGNTSGTNTGDETGSGIRTKLGITTLSGSNTGDQVLPTDATISISDVTTNNASAEMHGWAPKGSSGTTRYWREDWTLATPAGGGGGSANTGTATINFGTGAGSTRASVTVSGQTGITADSAVKVFIQGSDTTPEHNADEHSLLGLYVHATCSSIVAGVSFTITAISELEITGNIKARWEWT